MGNVNQLLHHNQHFLVNFRRSPNLMDDDEHGSRKRSRGDHQPSNPLDNPSLAPPPDETHTDEVNNNGVRVPLPARRQFRRLAMLDVPSNHPDNAMITPPTSSQILHPDGVVMPGTSLSHQRVRLFFNVQVHNVALMDEMENSAHQQRRHARLNIDDNTSEEDVLNDEMENLIDQHQSLISLIEEMSEEDFALFNEMENPVDQRQVDQHQDMRLNIDGMSYEELLQLGERIGSVSTGLSDETIALQLKTKYFSPSPIAINLEELPPEDEEANSCIICQEEFKNQEKIGVIKCEHEFHADCITQWLLLKNSCPICKLEALNDG
ncbi:unnamed protein product [Vicia faba]|uniref:RING-type E3 ubiquitin transferase n=1 Tax=Vicia faba TaxID=3906 RepID=A0AAV0Z7X7_VICFA|nr:unnamed protein product [Vicia faba]